jgi:hypothetical protein
LQELPSENVVEGKKDGRIELKGTERRSKHLLDYLKKTTGY